MNIYTCTTCGTTHIDLPSIGFQHPFYFDILNIEYKMNEEMVLKNDDFCVIKHQEQTDYFIRTVLQIPIVDHEETLDYGIWVSVSEATFKEYFLQYDNDKPEIKTYFGMIANKINDYDISTLGLHMEVETQMDGLRPLLTPYENEHDLIQDWINGITRVDAEKRIINAFHS